MRLITLIFWNLIISGLLFRLVFTPPFSDVPILSNSKFKKAPFFWITLYKGMGPYGNNHGYHLIKQKASMARNINCQQHNMLWWLNQACMGADIL